MSTDAPLTSSAQLTPAWNFSLPSSWAGTKLFSPCRRTSPGESHSRPPR